MKNGKEIPQEIDWQSKTNVMFSFVAMGYFNYKRVKRQQLRTLEG